MYETNVRNAIRNALGSLMEKFMAAHADTCPSTKFSLRGAMKGGTYRFDVGQGIEVVIDHSANDGWFAIDGKHVYAFSALEVAEHLGYHPQKIVRLLRSMEKVGEVLDAELERRLREAEKILAENAEYVSEIELWANR